MPVFEVPVTIADADKPMVTITQVQPIYVAFSVAESELPAVRLNLETHRLEVDAEIPNSPETPESPAQGRRTQRRARSDEHPPSIIPPERPPRQA